MFGIADLLQYVKAKDSLPSSLATALATQLEQTIRKNGFDDLPFPWKVAATGLLSSQQQEELAKVYPSFKVFTQSYNHDSAREEVQRFMKRIPDLEHFILKLKADHVAVTLTDEVVRYMDNVMDASGRATTRKILATSAKMTLLHQAAFNGESSDIETQLRTVPVDTFAPPQAWTPLHSAVLGKELKAVKRLIKAGANINAQLKGDSRWTLTPLILAVVVDAVEIAKYLLSLPGINVWARDSGYFSYTAAHYAAELLSDGVMLGCLIKHDSSLVEAKDVRRRTPIHRACLRGHVQNVKLLVKAGADIESRDLGESTPLHRAYAAAGGLQGLQHVENPADRVGERVQIHEHTMAPNFRSILGSFMPPSTMSTLELPPEMLAGYKSLIKETPKGHAAFVQIWKSYSTSMDQLYDQMASTIELASASEPLPHIWWHKDRQSIEINVHQFMERRERRQEIGAAAVAKGQKGVTYLPPGPGREAVYFLLSQGASPTAINRAGYAPEGFAYRPTDLEWSMALSFAETAQYEPKARFCTLEW